MTALAIPTRVDQESPLMNAASPRGRSATLAALLISCSASLAPAAGHATKHANIANNAAKEEAAAIHRQEQAMMHEQQAMVHQQARVRQEQEAASRRNNAGRSYAHHNVNHHMNNNASHRGYASGSRRGYTNGNHHSTGAMVSSLRSVMTELNKADHDYDGHRVRAIHHLGQAIHTLQPQSSVSHLAANKGAGTANRAVTTTSAGRNVAGAPAARMPQAESDAHLKRAREGLMNMQSRMAGGNGINANGTSTGGHQPVQLAHNHVQKAMQELNLALNIR